MQAVIQLLIGAVGVVSFVVGPIAGVWLLLRGDWWALGYALLGILGAHLVISILLLPATALGVFMATKATGHRLRRIHALPGWLYVAALMTLWCLFVLEFFEARATADNWIPVMLLAFSVADGPWSYLASKETQTGAGEVSVIMTFFMNLALAIVIGVLLIDQTADVKAMRPVFALIMAVAVLVVSWATSPVIEGGEE